MGEAVPCYVCGSPSLFRVTVTDGTDEERTLGGFCCRAHGAEMMAATKEHGADRMIRLIRSEEPA